MKKRGANIIMTGADRYFGPLWGVLGVGRRFPGTLLLMALLILYPSGSFLCRASTEPLPDIDIRPVTALNAIAVLPFENLTDDPDASRRITALVTQELKNRGFSVIDADAVEEFLAKRRIRYTGAVTRMTAREMGEAFDVDAVLVGSVTLFSSEDRTGEVLAGVAARLVSTEDCRIIWANTISHSGDDFEGFLGLGILRTLDELGPRIVKKLFEDVPTDFSVRNNSLPPFEIMEVVTTPEVGRSGEAVELRVKVAAITEEPGEIRAVMGGREFILDRSANGDYRGIITAPDGEGMYTIDVVAVDGGMKSFLFSAAGKMIIDNTPPKVSLVVNRKIFSPKKKGFVTFTPKMMNLDEVAEWRIEILNERGERVRGDRGYGDLPRALIWKGETDTRRQAEDGWYTYHFVVRDLAGNETRLTDGLRLKNHPPRIAV